MALREGRNILRGEKIQIEGAHRAHAEPQVSLLRPKLSPEAKGLRLSSAWAGAAGSALQSCFADEDAGLPGYSVVSGALCSRRWAPRFPDLSGAVTRWATNPASHSLLPLPLELIPLWKIQSNLRLGDAGEVAGSSARPRSEGGGRPFPPALGDRTRPGGSIAAQINPAQSPRCPLPSPNSSSGVTRSPVNPKPPPSSPSLLPLPPSHPPFGVFCFLLFY